MDYTFYETEDFVADDFFIQWVKHPTPEANAFWSAWLSKHPQREPAVQKARQIVLMLDFDEIEAPEGKFLQIWQKINSQDNQRAISVVSERSTSNKNYRYVLAAACSLIVLTAFLYGIMYWKTDVWVHTKFGESRTLLLPDSTKVMLNANSSLRYGSDFSSKREVWLTGEGFFVVQHKKDNQNFRVHTEDVQVEVLGTRFNVNTRRGKSQVVLEEGSVKLAVKTKDETSELILKPGDLAEVSAKTKDVKRKIVNVENYSSWRVNKLIFNSTPLEDIIQLLEENYGYQVEFKKEELDDLAFTGSAALDNPNELLQKLRRVFNLVITQEGDKLTIRSNK